jgi:hypothetical protein
MSAFIYVRRGLCTALNLLKLHRQDCEHCAVLEDCRGLDMRRRLQELNEEAVEFCNRTRQNVPQCVDSACTPHSPEYQDDNAEVPRIA